MIKIVVDAYGGDNSPLVNFEGALKALQNLPEVEIVLVGNQEEIENFFADKQIAMSKKTSFCLIAFGGIIFMFSMLLCRN